MRNRKSIVGHMATTLVPVITCTIMNRVNQPVLDKKYPTGLRVKSTPFVWHQYWHTSPTEPRKEINQRQRRKLDRQRKRA
jgi:hypothetical protein